MSGDIYNNPKYKASMDKIEEAIRSHVATLREIGEDNGDNREENSMVFGWVLTVGEVGVDDKGEEFNTAFVEYPDSQNMFTTLGLADHGLRFMRSQLSTDFDGED